MSGSGKTPVEGPDERIEAIEKEVKELKESIPRTMDNLKEAVESLREAVVEIKSAVSELENPFNLLRVLTSEEELRRMAEARSRARTEVEARPSGPKPPEPKVEELQKKGVEVKERVKVEERAEVPTPPLPLLPLPSGFEEGVLLIKWVWTLLDAGMDREDVIDITKFCEFLGLLPSRSGEHVSYLINTMIKARAGGLTLDEFLLIIYSAARAAGIKLEMRELEETAFRLLRRILKKMTLEEGG